MAATSSRKYCVVSKPVAGRDMWNVCGVNMWWLEPETERSKTSANYKITKNVGECEINLYSILPGPSLKLFWSNPSQKMHTVTVVNIWAGFYTLKTVWLQTRLISDNGQKNNLCYELKPLICVRSCKWHSKNKINSNNNKRGGGVQRWQCRHGNYYAPDQ